MGLGENRERGGGGGREERGKDGWKDREGDRLQERDIKDEGIKSERSMIVRALRWLTVLAIKWPQKD